MPRALLRAHVAVGTRNISAGEQSQAGHGAHGPASLAEVVSSRCRDTLPQELTRGVRNGDSLRSINALHVCMFVKYRHTHAHTYTSLTCINYIRSWRAGVSPPGS